MNIYILHFTEVKMMDYMARKKKKCYLDLRSAKQDGFQLSGNAKNDYDTQATPRSGLGG